MNFKTPTAFLLLKISILSIILAGALPASGNPTFIQWGTAQSELTTRLAVDASGGAWLIAIPGGGDPRRFFAIIEKDAP